MIVRNKSLFAIEIKLNDSISGVLKLWIQDKMLGGDEEALLLPNLNALKRIKDYSSSEELNIFHSTPNKIFRSTLNRELYDRTLLGFGESFDLFEIRAYIFMTKVVFIWEVTKDMESSSFHNTYKRGETYMGMTDSILYFETISRVNALINENDIWSGFG